MILADGTYKNNFNDKDKPRISTSKICNPSGNEDSSVHLAHKNTRSSTDNFLRLYRNPKSFEITGECRFSPQRFSFPAAGTATFFKRIVTGGNPDRRAWN